MKALKFTIHAAWLAVTMACTSCGQDDALAGDGFTNVTSGLYIHTGHRSDSPLYHGCFVPGSRIGADLLGHTDQPFPNTCLTSVGGADGWRVIGGEDVPSLGDKVVAYAPYNPDVTDYRRIPVDVSTGDEYRYSGYTVTSSSGVTLYMMPVLTKVVVMLDRSISSALQAVSVQSARWGVTGSFDADTGVLHDVGGADDDIPLAVSGYKAEGQIVPLPDGGTGSTTLHLTLDGVRHTLHVDLDYKDIKGRAITLVVGQSDGQPAIIRKGLLAWDSLLQEAEMTGTADDEYTVSVTGDRGGIFYHNVQNFTGVVDWGDGEMAEYTRGLLGDDGPVHRYTRGRRYTIKCKGYTDALNNLYPCLKNQMRMDDILHVGGQMGIADLSCAFMGSTIGTLREGLFRAVAADVTGITNMFADNRQLSSLPHGLFDGFTRVTGADEVFAGCTALAALPGDLFADMQQVRSFNGTFRNCISLTELPSELFANNSEVTSFGDKMPQISTDGTFYGCTGLTSIPPALFAGCPEVTDFNGTFMGCTSLTEIPSDLFRHNTQARNFDATFFETSIRAIDPALFVSNIRAEWFGHTFGGCRRLETVPDSLLASNPGVSSVYGLFGGAGLTKVPTVLFDHNKQITDFRAVFAGCPLGRQESPYTVIDTPQGEVKVHLYERHLYGTHFATPERTDECFYNCTELNDWTYIPQHWTGNTKN